MISYQPLEPGQDITGAIREARVQDDQRRWQDYRGGNHPILLRVYAQPTDKFPVRMPKRFYDGVRQLGWWIVRDIYFGANYSAADAITRGKAKVDAVINEVAAVGGLDRIFAWELGNEFRANTEAEIAALTNFVCAMATHLKARLAEPGRERFSNWVTWGSWPPNDPLRSDGNPVLPPCLDYVSYNVYSYDPERLRDHQGGAVTGRPFAGYLAALKARYPNLPLVISETGLPDNPTPKGLHQTKLHPWYPAYRRGGLTSAQVAEALADRYWDARLGGAVAGISYFEWCDEWHKVTEPGSQNDDPEESFGLLRFTTSPRIETRNKLQQQTVRDLFTMQFPSSRITVGVQADATTLPTMGTTTLRARVSTGAAAPVRFRWESTRGFIIGDADTVQLHAGGAALGPVTVTVVAIDANGFANSNRVTLATDRAALPKVEILTLGQGGNVTARASGRVSNVNLQEYKLAAYIQTNQKYVQPFLDLKSIWIQPDGYWWTPIDNRFNGQFVVHLVPVSYNPPATLPSGFVPSGTIATATGSIVNDADNDLLPDLWEPSSDAARYDDPDGDGADNLEEFLAGTSPTTPDNDRDTDGLPDNWERRYVGDLNSGGGDDPDDDGLTNAREFAAGTHPARAAADRDADGLPDSWELRFFGSLSQGAGEDPDRDGRTNLDAYELGLTPVSTPPELSFRLAGVGALELCWPSFAADYFLEQADNLTAAVPWSESAAQPALLGNVFLVTVGLPDAPNTARFYRLKKR